MPSNIVGYEAQRARRRYRDRIARNLCRRCGKEPPILGKTRCARCAQKDRQIGRATNRRTGKAVRYYHANKDKYRNWYYLRKYGITLAQYRAHEKKQGGVCAVCRGKPKNGRVLDVDHCHKRGVIRGLLCPSCNTAIGHFRENVEFFLAAIAYLKRTRKLG